MRVATISFVTVFASILCACSGGDDHGGSSTSGTGGNGTAGSGGSSSGSGGSGVGGSVAGAGGSSSSGGVTPCGSFAGSPKSCIAGQYCADELVSQCQNGCLSNSNCSSDQECSKVTGENVGSCQQKATPTTCDVFVSKCEACGQSRAACQQACAAASPACVECVVKSNCGQGCEQPCGVSGQGGSAGSGAGGCLSLSVCCDKLNSETGMKDACEQVVEIGSDGSCNSALATYQTGGFC